MIRARHMFSPRAMLALAVLGGVILFAAAALGAAEGATALPGARIARIVLGTIVVVGLLLLTARFLPRLGGVRGIVSEAFRVVATLPVGQRERVVIVQVGEQQLVLGVAPGRVEMIHELAAPLPERANAAVAAAPSWLNRVVGSGS